MNKKHITILAVSICIILISWILFANRTSSKDNKINIVTSFYPMYIATMNLTEGIDVINVENLTSKVTGCVHDYTLTPQEMMKMSNADALIINGNSMENFIESVMKNITSLKLIDTSGNGVTTIDDEHGVNPHTFVSIKNYIIQIENLANGLKETYPEYAEKITHNSNIYVGKLEKLYNDAKLKLDKYAGHKLVALHDSFEYFAKDFGIEVVAVIEEEEGVGASATDVANIITKVKNEDVKALIVDIDSNTNTAQAISKESGARICEFDSTISGENTLDEYITKMEKNINDLANVLGGYNAEM